MDCLSSIIHRIRSNPVQLTVGSPDRDLCDYSILDCVEQNEKDRILTEVGQDSYGNRAIGCMVGMAVGDSVGAPLEFLPAVDQPGMKGSAFSLADLSYSNAFNKFNLESGQWTDDTSMGLCMAG